MIKKTHILTILGILIYVSYALINRFIYEVPDLIALPLLIMTMAMIVIGAVLQQRNRS